MSFSCCEHVLSCCLYVHTHSHTCIHTYRVIHNSLRHFIQSLHLNGVKDSTCDPHVEKETLQVYLYMPLALSFVGGRQGSRLNENSSNRGREGFLLPEYAQTQSIVAVRQSFQTKFGKDLPVRKSTNQWHEKFQRDRCLCIVQCPGQPGSSQ
jgi:hypothetical protein